MLGRHGREFSEHRAFIERYSHECGHQRWSAELERWQRRGLRRVRHRNIWIKVAMLVGALWLMWGLVSKALGWT